MDHISTDRELLQIQLVSNDEHEKLLNEISTRKSLIKSPTTHYQNVPIRIKDAFHYVEELAHEKKNILAIEEICNIHRLLNCSGKFRAPATSWFDENNIGVNGYHPPTRERDDLEGLVAEYVREYTVIDDTKNPLEKACRAYFVFEQIHPFNDGNGRTGRAICAWIMFKYGYGFLTPYIEKCWGHENKQHAAAFKSEIHHYLAWSNHQNYLNAFYSKFYLYFLTEIINLLDQFSKFDSHDCCEE